MFTFSTIFYIRTICLHLASTTTTTPSRAPPPTKVNALQGRNRQVRAAVLLAHRAC